MIFVFGLLLTYLPEWIDRTLEIRCEFVSIRCVICCKVQFKIRIENFLTIFGVAQTNWHSYFSSSVCFVKCWQSLRLFLLMLRARMMCVCPFLLAHTIFGRRLEYHFDSIFLSSSFILSHRLLWRGAENEIFILRIIILQKCYTQFRASFLYSLALPPLSALTLKRDESVFARAICSLFILSKVNTWNLNWTFNLRE